MKHARTPLIVLFVAITATMTPSAGTAQSRGGLRAGLAQSVTRRESAGETPAILSDTRGHWIRGAAIGGLAGLGLALFYHAVADDAANNWRLRAFEFAFGSAVIGAMIGAR